MLFKMKGNSMNDYYYRLKERGKIIVESSSNTSNSDTSKNQIIIIIDEIDPSDAESNEWKVLNSEEILGVSSSLVSTDDTVGEELPISNEVKDLEVESPSYQESIDKQLELWMWFTHSK